MNVIILCGTMGSGKDTVASILAQHSYVPMALADELKRLAMSLFPEDIDAYSCFGPSSAREKTFLLTKSKVYEATLFLADFGYASEIEHLYQAPIGSMLRLFSNVMSPKFDQEVSVRWVLQHLGTEWGRKLNQNLWINILRRNIETLQSYDFYRYTREVGLIDDAKQKTDKVVVTDARFTNELIGLQFIDKAKVRQYWVDASKRIGENKSTHASEPKDDVRALFSDEWVIDNNGTLQELEQRVLRLL